MSSPRPEDPNGNKNDSKGEEREMDEEIPKEESPKEVQLTTQEIGHVPETEAEGSKDSGQEKAVPAIAEPEQQPIETPRPSSSGSYTFSEDSLERMNAGDQAASKAGDVLEKKKLAEGVGSDTAIDSGLQALEAVMQQERAQMRQLLVTQRYSSSQSSISGDSLERGDQKRVSIPHEIISLPGPSREHRIIRKKRRNESDDSSDCGIPYPPGHMHVVEVEIHEPPKSPKANVEGAEEKKKGEGSPRPYKKRRTPTGDKKKELEDLDKITVIREDVSEEASQEETSYEVTPAQSQPDSASYSEDSLEKSRKNLNGKQGDENSNSDISTDSEPPMLRRLLTDSTLVTRYQLEREYGYAIAGTSRPAESTSSAYSAYSEDSLEKNKGQKDIQPQPQIVPESSDEKGISAKKQSDSSDEGQGPSGQLLVQAEVHNSPMPHEVNQGEADETEIAEDTAREQEQQMETKEELGGLDKLTSTEEEDSEDGDEPEEEKSKENK